MTSTETLPRPVQELLDRQPDSLRAIVVSTDEGVEPLFFRDDVEADADPDTLERKAGVLSSVVESGGQRTPFGAYRTGIRIYDEVAVVHLPVDGETDGNVVISTDTDGIDPAAAVTSLLFEWE